MIDLSNINYFLLNKFFNNTNFLYLYKKIIGILVIRKFKNNNHYNLYIKTEKRLEQNNNPKCKNNKRRKYLRH